MSTDPERRQRTHIYTHTCVLTLAWPSVVWLSSVMTRHHVDMVVMTLGSGHLRPRAPWGMCLDVIIVRTLKQTHRH